MRELSNDILKRLNQRPIAFYPFYTDLTGSTTTGIVLSQLMCWFSKKDKFRKTDVEIKNVTHISTNELRTVKFNLKRLDFLTIKREGVPAKTHYEIDWDKYTETITNFLKELGI